MPSEIHNSGRDPVLPAEALIHTVEPTTTTTTKPVIAVGPNRQSRKRSISQDALSALTSPRRSSSSTGGFEDYRFPPSRQEKGQEQQHDIAETDSLVAFPSYDSYSPSPFRLLRSFSLHSPQTSQAAQQTRGRAPLSRTLTSHGPSPARHEAPPRDLRVPAEREVWMLEALARTHTCLWAGHWWRTSGGGFMCPCGKHPLDGDSPLIRSLEDKMREMMQDLPKKEE